MLKSKYFGLPKHTTLYVDVFGYIFRSIPPLSNKAKTVPNMQFGRENIHIYEYIKIISRIMKEKILYS